MPFNLRYFEDETKAKMGVNECVKNKLVEPFQVLYEKPSKLFLILYQPHYCDWTWWIMLQTPIDPSELKFED